MHIRSGLFVLPLLASSACVYAAMPAGDYIGSSSNFAVSQKTEVPGLTLKPGDYTIKVLDQLSDRMIVRVDSATSKDHTIFLAVPNASISTGGAAAVNYPTSPKGTQALRGFSFAAGSAVEFVYPKTEAVALAKLNSAKVIAVDPESQGMATALKSLSSDDLRIVNLWVLSLTTTGTANRTPAVLAQRFQNNYQPSQPVVASTPSTSQAQPPVQVASVEPQQSGGTVWDPAPTVRRSRPVLAKLPKTAGEMPAIWLFGLISFLAAGMVRLFRTASSNA